MTEAFFEPLGDDTYMPTAHTRGPWGPDSQHGGPVAALLGRALQGPAEDMFPARITYEILSPIRIVPLRVATQVERPGNKVRLVRASLIDGEREVMRAQSWMIRSSEGMPVVPPGDPVPAAPEALPESQGFPAPYTGYIDAMEWRFASGHFTEPGPAAAWLRPRYPLLEHDATSPLTRVLIAADSASGVSSELDWREWLFINVDLSVYLHRLPRGEWVCLDARTVLQPNGVGLATSTIFDREGAIGRTQQSLFVDRRG